MSSDEMTARDKFVLEVAKSFGYGQEDVDKMHKIDPDVQAMTDISFDMITAHAKETMKRESLEYQIIHFAAHLVTLFMGNPQYLMMEDGELSRTIKFLYPRAVIGLSLRETAGEKGDKKDVG